MKIYNKVVIDMKTNKVIEEDSFEYDGPLALCDGGLSAFIPLIAAALTTGGGLYMNSQAQKNAESNAEDIAAQNAAAWKANAFPSQAEMTNKENSGRAMLGSERSRSYENLAKNLSLRGIGSNSPFGAQVGSQIEGSYLKGLGDLNNTIVKTSETPRFSYPFATPSNVTGGGSGALNPLGMALGMMAGRTGGTTTPTPVPGSTDSDWSGSSGWSADNYSLLG